MKNRNKLVFVGVDTHKFTHTAVVINCWGDRLGEITFENKPSAFEALLYEVQKHTKTTKKAIFGLEDCGGVGRALAVFLIKRKKEVKEVDSSLANLERKAMPIYHKDDSFDAFCVARVLLTRLETLRDSNPQDLYWTINQLVERRGTLVRRASALKNQLHVQLAHNYPSYNKFFSEIDGKTALEFWEKYPSPEALKDVTLEELTTFLYEQSNYFLSVYKAKEILMAVDADGETTIEEYQYIRNFLIKNIVTEIRFIMQEVEKVENEIDNIVKSLGYKLHTMNGIDSVMAAKLISEIGDIRRFATPHKLARYAGVAPVTYSSGQKEKQYKSRQGNRTLYGVFHLLAVHQIITNRNTNTPRNPVFYEYYQKKISEGKTPGQALVCIARRLVNIIYGMMRTKSEYILPNSSKEVQNLEII